MRLLTVIHSNWNVQWIELSSRKSSTISISRMKTVDTEHQLYWQSNKWLSDGQSETYIDEPEWFEHLLFQYVHVEPCNNTQYMVELIHTLRCLMNDDEMVTNSTIAIVISIWLICLDVSIRKKLYKALLLMLLVIGNNDEKYDNLVSIFLCWHTDA